MREFCHSNTTPIALFVWTKKIQNIVAFEHSEGIQGTRTLKDLRHSGKQRTLGHSGNLALPPLYLPNFRKPFHHIIQLYSQIALALSANISLHSPLCHEDKWEELGWAIDSLRQSLICLCCVIPWFKCDLPGDRKFVLWEILRSRTCVLITGKNHILSTHISRNLRA